MWAIGHRTNRQLEPFFLDRDTFDTAQMFNFKHIVLILACRVYSHIGAQIRIGQASAAQRVLLGRQWTGYLENEHIIYTLRNKARLERLGELSPYSTARVARKACALLKDVTVSRDLASRQAQLCAYNSTDVSQFQKS